jgi:hypothetical protein
MDFVAPLNAELTTDGGIAKVPLESQEGHS